MHLQLVQDGTIQAAKVKAHIYIGRRKQKHDAHGEVLCGNYIDSMVICETTGMEKSDVCKKCAHHLVQIYEISGVLLSQLGIIDTDSF
jgi:hypothetical protein